MTVVALICEAKRIHTVQDLVAWFKTLKDFNLFLISLDVIVLRLSADLLRIFTFSVSSSVIYRLL
jgi:hypothetical protein